MRLFIDDERTCIEDGWITARTVEAAIGIIEENKGHELIISLDHDLGGDATTRSVINWMRLNGIRPDAGAVHSANTVGVEWLEMALDRDFGDPVPRIKVPRWRVFREDEGK